MAIWPPKKSIKGALYERTRQVEVHRITKAPYKL